MGGNSTLPSSAYSPDVACDDCDQVIGGGIYRRGIERLCRHCHTTRYPKSTAPILGCRAVHLEAPCIATPPPPQPLPPAPATTTPVIATSPPAVAPKPARTPKPPRAKPAPKPPQPKAAKPAPKPPKKSRQWPRDRAPVVLASGPMRPPELAAALGIRVDNIAAQLRPLVASGVIQRTHSQYHLPGQTPAPEPAVGRHNGNTARIRAALTEPMTLTELAAKTGIPRHIVRSSMTNAGAERCDHRQGVRIYRLKVP